jgi:hypothetical protein
MRHSALIGPDFTVSCPASAVEISPFREIRARGNLPLVLQQDMVIELSKSDLLESWREVCSLGRAKLNELVEQAAGRIATALEEEETADMGRLAGDAAAFFVMALRQKGVALSGNLPPCEMVCHTEDGCEIDFHPHYGLFN